jgi:hypothetical protein
MHMYLKDLNFGNQNFKFSCKKTSLFDLFLANFYVFDKIEKIWIREAY